MTHACPQRYMVLPVKMCCCNSEYMNLWGAGVGLPAGDGHRPAILQGLCQQEERAGCAAS